MSEQSHDTVPGRNTDSGGGFTDAVLGLVRIIAAVLGLAAMVAGLVGIGGLVYRVYQTLNDPKGFGAYLSQWATELGGEQFHITLQGGTFDAAPLVALVVVAGGTAILAWLCLGLLYAGARIIMWIAGNRQGR